MIAVEQNVFHSFLAKQDEKQWAEVIGRLLPSIHPVDQIATKIWFSFWPLRLARELQDSTDLAETAKPVAGQRRAQRGVAGRVVQPHVDARRAGDPVAGKAVAFEHLEHGRLHPELQLVAVARRRRSRRVPAT